MTIRLHGSCAPKVQAAMVSAMQAFAPPGTRVLLLTPAYSGFYSDIRYTHTVAEECLLKYADGKYSIDILKDYFVAVSKGN